jgi:hypothetical protein
MRGCSGATVTVNHREHPNPPLLDDFYIPQRTKRFVPDSNVIIFIPVVILATYYRAYCSSYITKTLS